MKVLIVGASGLIGGAVAAALAREGHVLLCTARDARRARANAGWPQERTRWVSADFDALPPPVFWEPLIDEGDVVINAAGLLRERRAGELDRVHHRGPVALFDACVTRRARLVLQLSALGAEADAPSRYHRTKAAADAHLRGCALPSAIVQPSLVWAPEGTSARLFAALAVLPFRVLPRGGRQRLQPVHLNDVVDGLCALVRQPPDSTCTVAFVGPWPLTLGAYLDVLRLQLGLRWAAPSVRVPARRFVRMAAWAGRWPGSLVDAETAGMLLSAEPAEPAALRALTGRPLRPATRFVPAAQAPDLRLRATTVWLAPFARLMVALLWVWTFAASIGLYPREQSLALLHAVGVSPGLAWMMLPLAAVSDLLLGLATLTLGARTRARWVWPLQLGLMGLYTLVLTLQLPEFWLHPFGPLSKNLPLVALIAWLWSVDAAASARPGRPKEPR